MIYQKLLGFGVPAALFLSGCGMVVQPSEPEAPDTTQALSNTGNSEICVYSQGLSDPGYASAEISYPCDLSAASYPATTLTGGFTNTKEQMRWLANHLTSHGYVVINMTPTNRYGNPTVWEKAHKAGFAKLASEDQNPQSLIYKKIDLTKRALTGYSMGGGGVLLAAEDMDNVQAATVALAPYLSFDQPDFAKLTGPTLVLGSENDELAYNAEEYYSKLPAGFEHGLGMYAGSSHYDWYGEGDQDMKLRFRTLITAFLNAKLKDDSQAYGYLDETGAEHLEHVAEGWFSNYDYQR